MVAGNISASCIQYQLALTDFLCLETPFDIIAMCVELIADDHATLCACSLAAPPIRRACYPHLFKQITLLSGSKNSTPVMDLIVDLDNITHLTPYVRTLIIEPYFASTTWGNPKRTTLTPCLLHALLMRLPRLYKLRLDCFTWAACKTSPSCDHGITPRSLSGLSISHVRLRGDIGITHLTRFFTKVDTLNIVDVLPTVPVSPPPADTLSKLSPSSLSVHISLDCYRHSNDPQHLLRYDTWRAVQRVLLLDNQLGSLKLVWTLSHARRGAYHVLLLIVYISHFVPGPSSRDDYSLDLSRCTRLQTVKLGASAAVHAKSTIREMAKTIKTLPPCTETLEIIVDTYTADRQDLRTFTSPLECWPNVWKNIAFKTNIRHLTILFTAFETSAGRSHYGFKENDYVVGFLAYAKCCLGTYGYSGCTYGVHHPRPVN